MNSYYHFEVIFQNFSCNTWSWSCSISRGVVDIHCEAGSDVDAWHAGQQSLHRIYIIRTSRASCAATQGQPRRDYLCC